MICYTNLGNSSTWVRWIKRKDGSYLHDFSVLERYLDMYEEEIGRPRVTCFYVWDVFAGGGYFGRKATRWDPVSVTCVDPETGREAPMDGPRYNTPEAETFWKPVAEGILERMKERGWEDTIAVGIATDSMPSKIVVNFWKKLWLSSGWVNMSHPTRKSIHGVKVKHTTYVWGGHGARTPRDPWTGVRYHGWRERSERLFNAAGEVQKKDQ